MSNNSPAPSLSFASSFSAYPLRQLILLLFIASCLFFAGLGRLPLLEPDEGRNAEVAREMLISGDWITPHFNSLAYLDKPAVFFWMVAASFRVAGISAWAARFPSALAALGTMLLTWFLARKMLGDAAGLRAGIIWATMPLVIIFSRLVIFDMTLTFLVTLAMLAFWLASTSGFERPWLEVVLFAACGLATITKGPVGFLLPWLSILAYQALAGRFKELKRLRWGIGIAAFLAATLPWFVAASVRNPDFPRYAFWQESLQRFATGHARRGGSIFYYLPVFLLGVMPWSLFLLFVGWNRVRRWKELRAEPNRPILFSLAWAGVIFAFFTISRSKLPAYFLPATVPLSILMAHAWTEVETEAARRRPDWLAAGFATLMATGLLVAVAAWEIFQVAAIRARMTGKIHPAVLVLLKPSLLYTGLILAALGILGRNLAERTRGRALAPLALALAALTAPVLFVRWIPVLRTMARLSSSERLAQTILASPKRDLPVYGFYCFRTSLPFYLRRPVGLITEDGGQMTSNYVALKYSEYRRATLPNVLNAGRVAPIQASTPTDLPFKGLLMNSAEFQTRTQDPAQATLALVRNNQVQLLMDTVPSKSSIAGLWAEWQYSVWEIRAPEIQSAVKP